MRSVQVAGGSLLEYGPTNQSILIGTNIELPCQVAEQYRSTAEVSWYFKVRTFVSHNVFFHEIPRALCYFFFHTSDGAWKCCEASIIQAWKQVNYFNVRTAIIDEINSSTVTSVENQLSILQGERIPASGNPALGITVAPKGALLIRQVRSIEGLR